MGSQNGCMNEATFLFFLTSTWRRYSITGWIRLQNGYYLPFHSDDGKVKFLHKVSTKLRSSTEEKRKLGASTPLFRPMTSPTDRAIGYPSGEAMLQELSELVLDDLRPAVALTADNDSDDREGTHQRITQGRSLTHDLSQAGKPLERVRAAIHMDAVSVDALLCLNSCSSSLLLLFCLLSSSPESGSFLAWSLDGFRDGLLLFASYLSGTGCR